MTLLGVNIDHVATLRNARGGREPEPVAAAAMAEQSGADQITVHLREDRRHIRDRDLRLLRETVRSRLNLEMSVAPEMVRIACEVKPDRVTLVPERREEVTTEGGLDCVKYRKEIARAIEKLRKSGIAISLFLDPEKPQLVAAHELGADMVELHTGAYANARTARATEKELGRLEQSVYDLASLSITPAAGHGLDYWNITPLISRFEYPRLAEVNIGHSIISRAVFCGLGQAVKDMKDLIVRAARG
ncbi:MAG: Pyridoxine 5'-phosphate synthase [Planctomycetes bacterium]|nr:Pyridoxine 5'-phosphate synthase [Planctomycetota bacterium]HRJ77993.1 pyridoxine 5'-phosphate synthase [Planctomycetota bacterium]